MASKNNVVSLLWSFLRRRAKRVKAFWVCGGVLVVGVGGVMLREWVLVGVGG